MWADGITITECFGLSPARQRFAEALLAIRGDAHTPKSRADLSTLGLLRPALSLPLWFGFRPGGRRAPIYNYYCHNQPDPALGWSVQRHRALDWRGGKHTYDSHNGTDFAVPPGTPIVVAAAGVVGRVSSEFHRGGLKVFVDHGGGLFTSYNHLSRANVRPGDRLARGQVLGQSGASGLDGFATFPFSTPHLHFNVWLGGAYVDPYARPGDVSLWRTADNDPRPAPSGSTADNEGAPTEWDLAAVEALTQSCLHGGARADILSGNTPEERAMNAHFQVSYFPTRFRERPVIVRGGERAPRLDLPLPGEFYDGVQEV